MLFFSRKKIFIILFFLTSAIFARNIEITVEDEDLSIPLEGAVITLRDGKRFICDEDGKVLVILPDNGQTVLQISYPGYENRRVVIPPARTDSIEKITASLRLGGIMESRELVIEARRPETSETRSGRSVTISERELARTAEIGIVEDVMNSIKLLPGVGYGGLLGAMPSIRGGDPGDLMAAFDGFYLERPYHWMGSNSIFDPKMVSSARLSHGVFSSRYGHTISGLLEVTSKSPSPTETELDVAIGTSAAGLNLSYPMNGRGGILFMGKVTYWDTLIWTAKGLSRIIDNEALDSVNAIKTSPYIRSAALAANYRISQHTEWRLNGFFGSDGVGLDFSNEYDDENVKGNMEISADYNNYQGFLISGLITSPNPALAFRLTGGLGFIKTVTEDLFDNNITARYNNDFINLLPGNIRDLYRNKEYKAPDGNVTIDLDHTIFNAQLRSDLDWELGSGFIAAFGIQELYSLWLQKQDVSINFLEMPIDRLPPSYIAMIPPHLFPIKDIPHAALIRPMSFNSDLSNHGFTTSAYGLFEYINPSRRFGAELGLRVDHMFFFGKDFQTQTMPALNPRLNIDYTLLNNRGEIDTLALTLGTGLFSSMNNLISFVEGDTGLRDFDLKFNRSWTSVIGLKLDHAQGYSFNIEGYYKRVFDRAYMTVDTTTSNEFKPSYLFDGIGNVWGFDFQLQKMESRYWDGWISYSFNWAKYFDPSSGDNGLNMNSIDGTGGEWYYPSFHRFHNVHLVLNIKPVLWFNIALRLGFASGQEINKIEVGDVIYPYPVQVVDDNFVPILDDDGNPVIIQKYRRDSQVVGKERRYWALPLDAKFIFFTHKKGRTTTEIYFAVETNLATLFTTPSGNTRFNEYTGREDTSGTGSNNAFDLFIPLVSFGFKWRY
ncbi:MAG: hypothetical protein LBH42_05570 [Treponema sp.]|jgi:hypothetical protein|nr:hypothetical protein [Treponema sp.]